jgi:hypothetical protein
MSGAYHPQTDGQSERVNQCLEFFVHLRCFVHACPKQWSSWLSLAEYWYNTCFHTALQTTPFFALYGHEPNHFGITSCSVVSVPDLASSIQQRNMMNELLHQHLLRAQAQMKKQAHKNLSERTFDIGEFVYLKLQPYVQTSVSSRSSNKLSFKFFGPYEILDKIGNVAYKLKLSASSTVHFVFHVSQLKKAPGTGLQVTADLPSLQDPLQVPLKILIHRMVTRGRTDVLQVLIQWSGLPPSLAT